MGQARQRAMRGEIDRYHANTLCLRSNKGTRASANAEKSSVCENYIFNRATVFWTELMTFGQTNGIKWTNESGTERCGENGRARERERGVGWKQRKQVLKNACKRRRNIDSWSECVSCCYVRVSIVRVWRRIWHLAPKFVCPNILQMEFAICWIEIYAVALH